MLDYNYFIKEITLEQKQFAYKAFTNLLFVK